MRQRRILVFSATFGNGHLRAAEALIEAIREKEPTTYITHLDFGQFLSKSFNFIIKNTYSEVLKYTPKLWGQFYYKTSKVSPDSLFQKLLNGLGRRDFLKYIESFRPDLIVCTYPTVAGTLAQLREKGELSAPLAAVVTDYAVHAQWIHKGVDLYIVGCGEIFAGLTKWGIDPGRIHRTGIPIHSRFEKQADKEAIRRNLKLNPDLPTCLVMGGAYGAQGGIKWVCKLLADMPVPAQTVVVCGRDEKLYKSLESVVEEGKNYCIRLGFVDNVDELMSVSDLIISKAGGLTVTEALTKGVPMIIYKPIPGQEEENSAFLERLGAGIAVKDDEQLESSLIELLQRPDLRQKMREAARKAVPRHSAEKAADLMLQLINIFKEKDAERKGNKVII